MSQLITESVLKLQEGEMALKISHAPKIIKTLRKKIEKLAG